MLRTLIPLALIGLFVWAPWMDSATGRGAIDRALEAFGPIPAVCYDSGNNILQDGVATRWYPFGRLVHACSGDYVVWSWGSVKELGGVYKKSEDIQETVARPLTCDEIITRQEARMSTSTSRATEVYAGAAATTLDFSLHPEAEQSRSAIARALQGGANFAGRFSVASWECGTNCQNHAVTDVETGLVVAYGLQTEFNVSYSLDSTLLITNPRNNLPELPESQYETESMGLYLARLPREYFQLTHDALSNTRYLVKLCVENAATDYVQVVDEQLGLRSSE